jgi:hypothetical protein
MVFRHVHRAIQSVKCGTDPGLTLGLTPLRPYQVENRLFPNLRLCGQCRIQPSAEGADQVLNHAEIIRPRAPHLRTPHPLRIRPVKHNFTVVSPRAIPYKSPSHSKKAHEESWPTHREQRTRLQAEAPPPLSSHPQCVVRALAAMLEPCKGGVFETLQPAKIRCGNRRMPWVFSLSASNDAPRSRERDIPLPPIRGTDANLSTNSHDKHSDNPRRLLHQ